MIDVSRLILSAPEEDADLTPVHKYEALSLMRDISAHATTSNTMPSWQVHGIKLRLDDFCDIVEDAALVKSKFDTINGMLLHLGVHICVLDHSVLSLLLVNSTMRLDDLSVSFSLPLLGLLNLRCVGHLRQ